MIFLYVCTNSLYYTHYFINKRRIRNEITANNLGLTEVESCTVFTTNNKMNFLFNVHGLFQIIFNSFSLVWWITQM